MEMNRAGRVNVIRPDKQKRVPFKSCIIFGGIELRMQLFQN